MSVVAAILLLLALAGIGYTLFAAWLVLRFAAARVPAPVVAEPVTLLKPLHGAEPRLAGNLASFLDQDWDAPIEMVCGVQRADDPAVGVVERFAGRHDPFPPLGTNGEGFGPGEEAPTGKRVVRLILDPTPHGANAKIANLRNMLPAASHDLLVLSDSDMAVGPAYLATLAAALADANVGAATCAYRGRGDAGRWSVLAAAGISYHFLPQLILGLRLGMARPGMGSTIALRRATLEAVGGFAPFADSLADDYALCEAVRAQGLRVAVPPMLLVHGCDERSLGEVWRHELRWAATILQINPSGQIGTIVTHPVPLALLCLPLAPGTAALATIVAVAARLVLKRAVDRASGASSAPAWALPARDCLSFSVFVRAFFVRSVDWRGARLRMEADGRIVPAAESAPS